MTEDARDRAEKLAGRWGSTDDEERPEGAREGRIGEEGEESGLDEKASKTVSESTDDVGQSQESEADEESERAEESRGEDGRTADEELTTREMQSQMLYLRPDFHRELDITFEELNLRFRREQDRKLQKNKDFYAGLLHLGLERLGDLDDRELEEIEELLDL